MGKDREGEPNYLLIFDIDQFGINLEKKRESAFFQKLIIFEKILLFTFYVKNSIFCE